MMKSVSRLRFVLIVCCVASGACAKTVSNSSVDASEEVETIDAALSADADSIDAMQQEGPNLLRNHSFEETWSDLPPAPGNLINQQPASWTLRWIEIDSDLFGGQDKSGGVPECVHKLSSQLPPHEQLGEASALILEGSKAYKMFHSQAPFGSELKQRVSDLDAGSQYRLIVPVQMHVHGDPDPYAAETGAFVFAADGSELGGQWKNAEQMGDRSWFEHEVVFTAPASRSVDVTVRVKSKWWAPKDFFMDNFSLKKI